MQDGECTHVYAGGTTMLKHNNQDKSTSAPSPLSKKLTGNGSEAYLFAAVKAVVKALPYSVDQYYNHEGYPTSWFTGPPHNFKNRNDALLALNIGTPDNIIK